MKILKKKPGDTRNKRYGHLYVWSWSVQGFPLICVLTLSLFQAEASVQGDALHHHSQTGEPVLRGSLYRSSASWIHQGGKKLSFVHLSAPTLTSLLPSSDQAFSMTEQEHDDLFKKVQNSKVRKMCFSECSLKNNTQLFKTHHSLIMRTRNSS